MRSLFFGALLLIFGFSSHGATLEEIWTVAKNFDSTTLGAGVEMHENTELVYPAQIYITKEKSWIEFNPTFKAKLSPEQFDFIIYHELGHLYLNHEELYQKAETANPGSGMALRRAFVLESDQFATLMFLKFGRNWDEIEKMIAILIERNAQGEWIPEAKERVQFIYAAKDYFSSIQP